MGIQQETNFYSDTDSLLSFPSMEGEDMAVDEKCRPYSVLAPGLKELTMILEGNCSVEKLEHYRKFLSNYILQEKRELSVARHESCTTDEFCHQSGPSGNMISCSVHSNKRHKSHGTKHAHVTSYISSLISILSFNSSYVKQRIDIQIMLDVSCCN